MGASFSDECGSTSLEYAIVAWLASLVIVGLLSLAILTGHGLVVELQFGEKVISVSWPPPNSEQAGKVTVLHGTRSAARSLRRL
jgi:Flp pilus assembly pilin Flp